MEMIYKFMHIFLHLDKELASIIQTYGSGTYFILFLIIFCETGLVVTPFLPGDSLLFAAGVFASLGSLNIGVLIVLLCIAAILGDTINYWVGHFLGPRIFRGEKIRFLNQKHLDRTHDFFERYGAETIIIARFVPIIRTFAPFVAGMGKMNYFKFITYNVFGGILWVVLLTMGGYLFANNPVVKNHFSFVVIAIIIISLIPGVVEFARSYRNSKKEPK